MYAYATYIAENAESLNLVEGEKVYVIGKLIPLVDSIKGPDPSDRKA